MLGRDENVLRAGSTGNALGLMRGSLRIRGQESREAGLAASPGKIDGQNANGQAESASSRPTGVPASFASALLPKLLKAGEEAAPPKTSDDAQKLLDSLVAVVNEASEQFGQDAANKMMADILTGAANGVDGNKIAGAISGVLKELSAQAENILNAPQETGEKLEQARLLQQKLHDFLQKLNGDSADESDGQTSGLSGALNDYFGLSGLAEDHQKKFGDDYLWASPKDAAEENGGGYTEFSLTAKELGREVLNGLADYLRNEMGCREAADYIANLGDGDDVFDAVDYLRNMFMQNTSVTDPSAADIQKFGASFPQRVGPGLEDLKKLNGYLASHMVDAVNVAIKNNPQLSARMKAVNSHDGQSQAEGYGLFSWPGAVVSGRLCDVEYGKGHRSWSFGDVGDASTMERLLKNSYNLTSSYYNFMAEKQVDEKTGEVANQAEHEKYKALASSLEAAYQDKMRPYQQNSQLASGLLTQQVA